MKKIFYPILAMGFVAVFAASCATPLAVEPSAAPEETSTADTPAAVADTPAPDLPAAVGKLHWFGVSSILYHGSKNIYFDPVMLEGNLPPADIIFISHGHSDHADLENLQKIIASGTVLIISPNASGFCNSHAHEIGVVPMILEEGESVEIGDIRVEAVPAYDDQIHLRDSKGLGFVVTVDGEQIYFAGGTRVFPEMAQIESDVSIYPWYRNADVLEAAKILPTLVLIPVHAGASGVKAFVDLYAKEITRLRIVALEPGPYNP